MGKLLFWAIAILAILVAMRMISRKAARRGAPPAPPSPRDTSFGNAPETMVRCAHCGVHLPRSEALLQNGRTWCSEEHARLGAPQ